MFDEAKIAGFLYAVSYMALPIIIAITLHEAAHGWAAMKLGDDTAFRLGRVTFNPLRHIDPFGTVLLPAFMYYTTGFMFGWAKPVPVNFGRLNNPRRDMVWVALAGPGTNILLAILSALLLHVVRIMPDWIAVWMFQSLQVSLFVNVLLAVFNMIPLPPLDGGRVAVGLLPDFLARPLARLENTGLLLMLFLLFLLPYVAGQFGYDFNLFRWLILPPTVEIIKLITLVTGLT